MRTHADAGADQGGGADARGSQPSDAALVDLLRDIVEAAARRDVTLFGELAARAHASGALDARLSLALQLALRELQ